MLWWFNKTKASLCCINSLHFFSKYPQLCKIQWLNSWKEWEKYLSWRAYLRGNLAGESEACLFAREISGQFWWRAYLWGKLVGLFGGHCAYLWVCLFAMSRCISYDQISHLYSISSGRQDILQLIAHIKVYLCFM